MIEDAIFLLKKMKKDAEFLTFTAYGSEKSYSINFPGAYIVVYKNESKIQMRFIELGDFTFSKEDFKDDQVKVFWDQDQLVLEIEVPKRFLKTFSSKAQGTFYLRNKASGFILTNKKGQFLNLNYTIKPVKPYLSWMYNVSFNYSNPWEDIWLYVFYNGLKIKETYFFENLTNIYLNFNKDNSNLSGYYPILFKIKTDFGNYWEKQINFEAPYNSKVNVTFIFNTKQIEYFNLSFYYIGKNWTIYLENLDCNNLLIPKKCLEKPLNYVCYVVISSFSTCKIKFYNLPTYTNYSIKYKVEGEKTISTWRIFTPYIKACKKIGSSLKCNESYWSCKDTTCNNSLIFVDKNITTLSCNFYFGIKNCKNYSYFWNGSEIEINLN